jgi:hypothetical protein
MKVGDTSERKTAVISLAFYERKKPSRHLRSTLIPYVGSVFICRNLIRECYFWRGVKGLILFLYSLEEAFDYSPEALIVTVFCR